MVMTDSSHSPGAAQDFRDRAAAWLRGNVPAEWRENRGALNEDDENRIRGEWDRTLFRGGFAGISLPTEYGGQGRAMEDEIAFFELAARMQAPDGLGRIGKILTAPTLITLGTEEQKAKYLPPILSGEEVWCQGFSEPGAGSDLARVSTRATRTEGGWLIRGTKTWTSFSRHAHRCLMLAKTDPEGSRYHNLTFFLLDMKQPTVRVEPIRQISGSSHFAETHYEDAFVPDSDVLGEVNGGWRVAMTVLGNERGLIEGIVRYVEIRADVDLLQTCCCAGNPDLMRVVDKLDARAEVLRWQVAKAVAVRDDEREGWRAASVLKAWWSEFWQEVTHFASTLDCPEHREHWRHQYLESRSATIYSGTSEIQRNVMAERILGLPK
jgi:alkylation response protein AidB-like acyl-CoA dehydrogenase